MSSDSVDIYSEYEWQDVVLYLLSHTRCDCCVTELRFVLQNIDLLLMIYKQKNYVEYKYN